MNIICNDCVGSRISQQTDGIFNNPFTWAAIDFSTYINIVNNFEKIDFKNVKFELKTHKGERVSCAKIEEKYNIRYIHYIQKDSVCGILKRNKTPDDISILSNDILSYSKEKYFSRLERMKEPPIFVYSFFYAQIELDEIKRRLGILSKIQNKKLIVLINLKYKNIVENFNFDKNIRVIFLTKSMKECGSIEIVKEIKDEFVKIVGEYEK